VARLSCSSGTPRTLWAKPSSNLQH
jgi:hypothetical protein